MATLTITVVSGAGTNSVTKNFSAADATRIMNAYKKANPNGTQADLVAWIGKAATDNIQSMVVTAEFVPAALPVPPAIT
jgi:hypothetical protein